VVVVSPAQQGHRYPFEVISRCVAVLPLPAQLPRGRGPDAPTRRDGLARGGPPPVRIVRAASGSALPPPAPTSRPRCRRALSAALVNVLLPCAFSTLSGRRHPSSDELVRLHPYRHDGHHSNVGREREPPLWRKCATLLRRQSVMKHVVEHSRPHVKPCKPHGWRIAARYQGAPFSAPKRPEYPAADPVASRPGIRATGGATSWASIDSVRAQALLARRQPRPPPWA
jgi:hypothetical protein